MHLLLPGFQNKSKHQLVVMVRHDHLKLRLRVACSLNEQLVAAESDAFTVRFVRVVRFLSREPNLGSSGSYGFRSCHVEHPSC